LTNSPILREIGYNQGNYILKGNHYVSTADGLYMIGKNALQKTGTKVVTNSNLAEFMRPGVNPISNAYYMVGNTILNPRNILYGYATIEALDGYYGGSAPAYNIGSFINGFENTTGIQIVPDWLKP